MCVHAAGPMSKGMIGVCYERYTIGNDKGGASFIFDTKFYDGFSRQEQESYLVEVGYCKQLADYDFSNVSQLELDYIRGKFDPVLREEKYTKYYD